jgi:eukaryotic-like serine/threonine-protein kinase
VQVAKALVAAQRAGIVHRDIKPENIMVRSDGYVKVLDFGLAKLTEAQGISAGATQPPIKTDTGVVMGTAHYMSPEQARGLSVDARTDVFSLGVVIYEMVTGEVPFKGETPSHVVVAILEHEPEPLVSHWPTAPAGLQKIINKALAKGRDKRYKTFDEFLTDLNSLSKSSGSESTIETDISSRAQNRIVDGPIIGKKPFAIRRWVWLALATAVTFGLAWVYIPRGPSQPTLPPMKVAPLTSLLGFELNPSFSPDGNFIAFCWGGEKDDNIDVYIQRIGSSDPPFRFTTDPAADINPVWSPDGAYIAFSRVKSDTEKAGYIKPYPGGPERKIYTPTIKAGWGGQKQIDWSPDGKFLVSPDRLSPDGPYQIILISPDTLEWRQLTFAPQNSFGDLNPQFSP